MKLSAIVFLALFSSFVIAANNPLMAQYVGSYPVTELNGEIDAAGLLEIIDADGGVGFRVTRLRVAGKQEESIAFITPEKTTSLVSEAGMLNQEYESPELKVRVSYRFTPEGNLAVQCYSCKKGGKCELTMVNDSPDGLGKSVDAKDFFVKNQGDYKIEFANGKKPKDDLGNVTADTADATITMPYCDDANGCMPGFVPFIYADTKIFHKQLSDKRSVTTLITVEGNETRRFTWETDSAWISFLNYQFLTTTEQKMVMEHIFRRVR